MAKRKAEESNPFLAELRAAQASLPRAPRVLDGSLADDARAELWNAVCLADYSIRNTEASSALHSARALERRVSGSLLHKR